MEDDFNIMFTDTVSIEKLSARAEAGAQRSYQEPVVYEPDTDRGGAHISSQQSLVAGAGSEQHVSGGAVYLPADEITMSLTAQDRLTLDQDVADWTTSERENADHPNILTVKQPRDTDGVHHVTVYLR